jgi:hypothetical protein
MTVTGRHAEWLTPDEAARAEEAAPAEEATLGGEATLADEAALADDPFADDLNEQLAARAPRRLANRTTIALAGLVLAVGGFVAGAQVEKHFGHVGTPATAFPTAIPTGFRGGGTGGGGTGGGGTGGGGSTTGTVKLVDGTTVYITTANGDVITVRTNGSTTITQPGSVTDLPVGSTVTVTGPAASDGTITASRIAKNK